jgi:hypothetical protein
LPLPKLESKLIGLPGRNSDATITDLSRFPFFVSHQIELFYRIRSVVYILIAQNKILIELDMLLTVESHKIELFYRIRYVVYICFSLN